MDSDLRCIRPARVRPEYSGAKRITTGTPTGGDPDRSPRQASSRWYLDTSAALQLIVEEAESVALAASVDAHAPDLVGCLLLETDLRRVVHRDATLTQQMASAIRIGVDRVVTYDGRMADAARELGLSVWAPG